MVLYLRFDKVLAFEECDSVIQREAIAFKTKKSSILLERVATQFEGHKVESVSKVLSYFRKEAEVGDGGDGKKNAHHGKGSSSRDSGSSNSEGKDSREGKKQSRGEGDRSKQQHMRSRKKHTKKTD